MADTGVSVDNPFVEALNRSVKVEEVYLNSYESLEHARQSIGAYINDYNTKRLHTSIGYKPPYEYLENFKKNVKEFAINSLCKLKRNSHKRGQTKIVSMLDSE